VKKLFTYDDGDRVVAVAYVDGEGNPIPVEIEVLSVFQGSTGERIGLAPADRLIEYNGQILTSMQQLIALTGMGGPRLRTLVVRRGSSTLSFQVPPGRIGVEIKNVKAQSAARTGMIRLKEPGRRGIDFARSFPLAQLRSGAVPITVRLH
jgi:PDZ domain